MKEHQSEPSLNNVAETLLRLLETSFRRSDSAVKAELIRVELETAYQRGREDGAHERL